MKSTWCCNASVILVLEEPAKTIWCVVNAVLTCQSTCTFFLNFRHNFSGDRKVNGLLAKVVLQSSLVVRQIASHQLGTSSENLVAVAQFLIALATSESQF